MDPRLLRVYNDELAYLREAAREFGEEHDVVAGYLGLKTPTDPDPYVERLLEGVAFLAARVQLKLQDQYPEFTQHLLQAVQPNYLAPTPSMCVVGFTPNEGADGLAKGALVPRRTELTAPAAGHQTQVRFLTGQDVLIYPVALAAAEYLGSRSAVASYAAAANVKAAAGLRIRFESQGGVPLKATAADVLPIYLAGSENVPGELYRQIIGDTVAVVAIPSDESQRRIILPRPESYGFGDQQALLPNDGRSFRGYRILAEYFACPERFLFVALRGLERAFSASETACDVVLLFKENSPILNGAVTASNLRLYATPAINLFPMQLGRIPISPYEHEYLVVPDRAKPIDYEVFQIQEVVAHGKTGPSRPVAPLHAFGTLLYDWQEALFYVHRLVPRRLSTREQRRRRRAEYVGSQMFISLASPGKPSQQANVRELAVRALVTNRELPELLRFTGSDNDFRVESPAVKQTEVLRAPTRPRPAMGIGDAAWRVIGHLTPNFHSLLDLSPEGVPLLRDHLALYGRADDPDMRRQIDGLLSLSSSRVTRRIEGADRIAFARGHRIHIHLDDASFDTGRMFLFSSVLDLFLGEFASVNTFVETVFHSPSLGEFQRWPARMGLRPTI